MSSALFLRRNFGGQLIIVHVPSLSAHASISSKLQVEFLHNRSGALAFKTNPTEGSKVLQAACGLQQVNMSESLQEKP
jgi:hypothetical protein